MLAGRRRQLLDDTARDAPAGTEVIAVPTDVAAPPSVGALLRITRERLGRLDLLGNDK